MPALILAGSGDLDLVLPLAARLRLDGGEVRCYLEQDDHELRQMGCKIAAGPLDDAVNVEAALGGVHTFIPILPDPAAVTDEEDLDLLRRLGEAAPAAAAASGVAQTIVALPGLASPASTLGAAYEEIHRLFLRDVRPLCLLRTGMVWGPDRPFTRAVRGLRRSAEAPAEWGSGEAPGESRLSVLHADDLVAAIAAADDREEIHGVWELGGRAYSLGTLLRIVEVEGEAIRVSPWFAQILQDGVAVGSSAAGELGIEPRTL